MSDEQRAQPDDSEPTPERQAQLQAAYEANVAASKAPYDGVIIFTQGEVKWIMRERRWSGWQVPVRATPADFRSASMRLMNLSGISLCRANLSNAELGGTDLSGAILIRADLSGAHLSALSKADLTDANLAGAILVEADLTNANLRGASLVRANLLGADLSGADLRMADLSGADLRGVRFTVNSVLAKEGLSPAALSPTTLLADVIWDDVPLARLPWGTLSRLGDEALARERTTRSYPRKGDQKDAKTRREEYGAAVRAYRLLAVALRSQGLNEHADRFTYRAQLCQRAVLRRQGIRKWPAYLGSLVLWALSGYGYRLWRILAAYAIVVLLFMGFYLVAGVATHSPLQWNDALLISFSAIHGRFGITSVFVADNPIRSSWDEWIAAVEAVFGIVIEGVFIAMLVQRFFASK